VEMTIPLVAYYWRGGAPREHQVRRVTGAGAHVLTPDRWYPGTVVEMVFHYDKYYLKVAKIDGNPGTSVRMRGRVVRALDDGVLVQFVYLSKEERHVFQHFLEGGRVQGQI